MDYNSSVQKYYIASQPGTVLGREGKIVWHEIQARLASSHSHLLPENFKLGSHVLKAVLVNPL